MANRLPVLIAIVFFLLVALVSLGVFERIPHVEDEAAYWFQAQVFARGASACLLLRWRSPIGPRL